MTLASLLNISDQKDFSQFAFANADHHRLVAQHLNQKNNLNLTAYVLDPIPEFDTLNWLRRHQQAHTDINNILGVQGADLTGIDFKNAEEREAWSETHFQEHNQWLISTGVA